MALGRAVTSRLVTRFRTTVRGSAASKRRAELQSRRAALLEHHQRSIFGWPCTDNLKQGRLVQKLILYVGSACLITITSLIAAILSPKRDAEVYIGYMLVILCKVCVTLVGTLDIALNLLKGRAEARRFGERYLPAWLRCHARGHGAYIPRRPERLLSDLFYGFPVGSFMVSYNWNHEQLPRRLAIDILPEQPPKHPNKCWLDIERLVPGTWTAPAMVAAVTEAEFVFVFLSPAYLASENCMRELKALRAKDAAWERSLIFVYDRDKHDQGTSAEQWQRMREYAETELGSFSFRPLVDGRWEKGKFVPSGRESSLDLPQARGYSAAHMIEDLIGSGGLARLLRERSPRINACWLATAFFLCETPLPSGASWWAQTRRVLLPPLRRFFHVLVLPLLLDITWYCWTVYVTSGELRIGALYSSTQQSLSALAECDTDGTSWSFDKTPGLLLAFLYLSSLMEVYFVGSLCLAIPILKVPTRSELSEMPDAGLLLLVLFKLEVLQSKVKVLDLSAGEFRQGCNSSADDGPCETAVSAALRVLERHGVIELIEVVDGAAAGEASVPCLPGVSKPAGDAGLGGDDADLLVVVDLDECLKPPSALARLVFEHGGRSNFIAWSVAYGFGCLEKQAALFADDPSLQWKNPAYGVTGTLVARPETADLMVETVLCRILTLALSHGGGAQCAETLVLTPGDQFEAGFERLQFAGPQKEVASVVDGGSKPVRKAVKDVTPRACPGLSTGMEQVRKKLSIRPAEEAPPRGTPRVGALARDTPRSPDAYVGSASPKAPPKRAMFAESVEVPLDA